MVLLSTIAFFLSNCLYFILSLSNGTFPKPLSAKEEREYLESYHNDGDKNARDILIERNMRLVAHVIKKYYTSPQDQDDLISIGSIGLIKAINTFKPNKGTRLATYAARCIENEVLMHFRASKKIATEVSLSETLDTDAEGNSLALLNGSRSEDIRLDKVESADTIELLYALVNSCLDKREREIIIMRYGLFDTIPRTQQDIAKKCNISRSYVSRLEKKALEKLRAHL